MVFVVSLPRRPLELEGLTQNSTPSPSSTYTPSHLQLSMESPAANSLSPYALGSPMNPFPLENFSGLAANSNTHQTRPYSSLDGQLASKRLDQFSNPQHRNSLDLLSTRTSSPALSSWGHQRFSLDSATGMGRTSSPGIDLQAYRSQQREMLAVLSSVQQKNTVSQQQMYLAAQEAQRQQLLESHRQPPVDLDAFVASEKSEASTASRLESVSSSKDIKFSSDPSGTSAVNPALISTLRRKKSVTFAEFKNTTSKK